MRGRARTFQGSGRFESGQRTQPPLAELAGAACVRHAGTRSFRRNPDPGWPLPVQPKGSVPAFLCRSWRNACPTLRDRQARAPVSIPAEGISSWPSPPPPLRRLSPAALIADAAAARAQAAAPLAPANVTLKVNGSEHRAAARHAHDLARRLARAYGADRQQEGLRPGPVRGLHGPGGRAAGAVLPHPGGGRRRQGGHHHRRLGGAERRAASHAAGVHRS